MPNIEYNLRRGNTLVGYKDISKFQDRDHSNLEYWTKENSLYELLEERENLVHTYKKAKYSELKPLRKRIEKIDKKLRELLDLEFYRALRSKDIKIPQEEFDEFSPFHWGFEFYEVFDPKKSQEGRGFDIIIGNPPYVRADNEDETYQRLREVLEDTGEYQTFYEKWDLFIAFIERSLKSISEGGVFSYIISKSFNTSKFAKKSKKFILGNYHLKKVDFFENIEIFRGVGVENVILIVENKEKEEKTERILHVNSFGNIEELEPSEDINKIFRIAPTMDFEDAFKNTELLGNICFISVGMVLNAHEKKAKGEFKKDDLISDTETRINSKPYVEAKYIDRYTINKTKYLEWDTERCPTKIRRPTFPELYIYPKIIRGATVDGTYDESGIICNHSINVMVRYESLKSVSNRSITMSITKWTDKPRDELEKISSNFDLKYILTVLNSKFAKFYLNTIRRHRIEYYFYPNDFKRLPVKKISLQNQQPFITLCTYMLFLNETEKRRSSEEKLIRFIDEQIIDSLIYELYFEEKLETTLMELVKPYLKGIENLKSEDEKLAVIKEIFNSIKEDNDIREQIQKIKSNEVVLPIEKTVNNY